MLALLLTLSEDVSEAVIEMPGSVPSGSNSARVTGAPVMSPAVVAVKG